jgi:hypothetical protein
VQADGVTEKGPDAEFLFAERERFRQFGGDGRLTAHEIHFLDRHATESAADFVHREEPGRARRDLAGTTVWAASQFVAARGAAERAAKVVDGGEAVLFVVGDAMK